MISRPAQNTEDREEVNTTPLADSDVVCNVVFSSYKTLDKVDEFINSMKYLNKFHVERVDWCFVHADGGHSSLICAHLDIAATCARAH